MSLKKRLFRSNMMILFLALASLLAVVLLILVIFEDSIEKRFLNIEQAKLDNQIYRVSQMVDEADIQDMESLEQGARALGYEAALIGNEEVIVGFDDERMEELAETLDTAFMQSGQTEIFYFLNVTVAAKYIQENEAYIVAAHFPEEDWLEVSLKHSFQVLLLILILICAGVILILLVLSSFFTKRMNRIVMEPLEALVYGAERIQNGRLGEPVIYEGEAEFENVCQAFNSMQSTILEDQRQRVKTEKARIDMITGISHDLRTPLTSIQGYIKGVLDGIADTEEKRKLYLKTAYGATEDMNRLLQKLFDFSRMESGQMPFHMVEANLAELLDLCVAQKEGIFNPEEVKFFCRWDRAETPEIMLDVEQFRRIFENLLENSMKYASARPVHIWLEISVTEKMLLLEWKDSGPGVPEEKMERIFERFYRCDESRNKKGSGVGLYVVKYIMERHGGSIMAENDGGLKLTLAFPRMGEEQG